MKHKILTMILLAGLSVSLLTGCGQTETASTADTQTTETTAQPEEPEQAEEVVTETTEIEVVSAEEPESTTEPSTEEPESTIEPSTEEVTEEPKPEYTYTDMSATMYATQTVNVRNLPSTDGEKVGSLSTNQEVAITGQASTGWYRIQYNGSEAYVSNKYLSDEKVEVKPATSESAASGTGSASTECPYPMLQVIDEGGDKVYYYYTPSTQNRNIYNECASIIASRHGWYTDFVNGGTAGSGGAGEPEKTNYTYNGEVVYRARPCTYLIGPNGGGPLDALEVVICP